MISLNYLRKQRKISLSPIGKSLFIFYLYLILDTYIHEYSFNNTYLTMIFLSLIFITFIENYKFSFEEKIFLFRFLKILILIIVIVSLLQMFVSPSIYYKDIYKDAMSLKAYGNTYRSLSIFTNMRMEQGPIAFILLFTVFLAENLENKNYKYLIFASFMFISGMLSLFRTVMVEIIISFLAYVFVKYKLKTFIIVTLLGVLAYTTYESYSLQISNSDFFRKRIKQQVTGRWDDPLDFFYNYITEHPIVFGRGQSSYMEEYHYYSIRRLHSGIWDMLYHGGIVGLFLMLLFPYYFYLKGKIIYKYNKNYSLYFFSFLYIGMNLTFRIYDIFYWGYLFMYVYLFMELNLLKQSGVEIEE
jgi:hypothetical protein